MENIVEKRRNCSWGAISPLFHNIFNISLTSKVQLPISLLNVVNQIILSSILQTWYVELRISRTISESPLEFEITRVDCMSEQTRFCFQKTLTPPDWACDWKDYVLLPNDSYTFGKPYSRGAHIWYITEKSQVSFSNNSYRLNTIYDWTDHILHPEDSYRSGKLYGWKARIW